MVDSTKYLIAAWILTWNWDQDKKWKIWMIEILTTYHYILFQDHLKKNLSTHCLTRNSNLIHSSCYHSNQQRKVKTKKWTSRLKLKPSLILRQVGLKFVDQGIPYFKLSLLLLKRLPRRYRKECKLAERHVSSNFEKAFLI